MVMNDSTMRENAAVLGRRLRKENGTSNAVAFITQWMNDGKWADWSVTALANASYNSTLYINQVVYTEVSIGFDKIEELESALHQGGFQMLEMPKEALFSLQSE
jgi:hypothetical protein